MSIDHHIIDHYTHGTLYDAILAGIGALGKTAETVSIDDLAPVDEFHIGGRQASIEFLDQLALSADHRVLDIGCGLGGPARFVATRYGASVSGIDLTEEFVTTGNRLCALVDLAERVTLSTASALDLPFAGQCFDAAYMMHVGMNISDKTMLFKEIQRVLKPAAVFGVYDVMLSGEGDLSYPVPWATTAMTSAVASPTVYRQALTEAGFEISTQRDRHEFALDFFQRMLAASANGPPPLGLHLVMGETRAQKVSNMLDNLRNGVIAPVEIICRNSS